MSKIKCQTVIPGAITQDDKIKLNQILDVLNNDNNSFIFRQPVDYEAQGLSDYLSIVETPMDLSTVREKLTTSVYSSAQEVINDIMLIWKNCKKYNVEGSEIYKCSEYMEKLSKRNIEKFYKVKFPKVSKFTFLKDYEDEDFLPPQIKEDKISFEDKFFLSDNIKKLSNEKLTKLILLLKNNHPGCLIFDDTGNSNQGRINVDLINKHCYEEISDFISANNLIKRKKDHCGVKFITSQIEQRKDIIEEKSILNTQSYSSPIKLELKEDLTC